MQDDHVIADDRVLRDDDVLHDGRPIPTRAWRVTMADGVIGVTPFPACVMTFIFSVSFDKHSDSRRLPRYLQNLFNTTSRPVRIAGFLPRRAIQSGGPSRLTVTHCSLRGLHRDIRLHR